MIKKIKLTLASISTLLLPVAVLAQMEPNAPGGPGSTVGSLSQLIHALENAAGLVFGAIAVIAFIVAGVLFLTAAGNAEKVQAARSALIWGIAGVVVGILAFSIIAVVGSVMR
jgi:hypothetical protein